MNLGQIKDANRNDILALPQLSDSYSALTQKVGLSFSWISRNMNSKFVFKGDEGKEAYFDFFIIRVICP